jgi:hypothetical protein
MFKFARKAWDSGARCAVSVKNRVASICQKPTVLKLVVPVLIVAASLAPVSSAHAEAAAPLVPGEFPVLPTTINIEQLSAEALVKVGSFIGIAIGIGFLLICVSVGVSWVVSAFRGRVRR